jgi:hypothetical protein
MIDLNGTILPTFQSKCAFRLQADSGYGTYTHNF